MYTDEMPAGVAGVRNDSDAWGCVWAVVCLSRAKVRGVIPVLVHPKPLVCPPHAA